VGADPECGSAALLKLSSFSFQALRESFFKKKPPLKAPPPAKPYSKPYWKVRHDLVYYQVVRSWMEALSPGGLLVDVGAWDTPVITWGDFAERLIVDLSPVPVSFPGVQKIQGNWLTVELPKPADLVVCLQVLEHLKDGVVEPFCQKLLRSGRRTLVSVPYRWKAGREVTHVQDPVDEAKLAGWMQREPSRQQIVTEPRGGVQRLVALYE